MIDKIIKFEQDTAERKRWFSADSFSHPAKMHLSLQLYLIEHYTKASDTILDPMTGSGTILVACALERNVICVELEEKFVQMQKDNWQKIKALGPMLGYKMGEAVILQGDARQLPELLVDKCVFSPPFADSEHNYKHGLKTLGKNFKGRKAWEGKGKADVVCTSPPYEHQIHKNSDEGKVEEIKAINPSHYVEHSQPVAAARYNPCEENIGNLKSESYLEAMLQVYQSCHRVLKEKGLMILVVKNFIREKKIVRLDSDTIKLCEQAGFALIERLKRKLTQISFWRRIYQQKFPDAPKIEYEDVLVFEREGQ